MMNNTNSTPNYPLRRAVALTIAILFINYVALPAFTLLLKGYGYLIVFADVSIDSILR